MNSKHGPIWVLTIVILAGLAVLFLPSWLKSSQDLWGGDYIFAWSLVQEKALADKTPALWDSSYHLGGGAGTLVPSPQILLSGVVSPPWYIKVRVVFNFVVGAVGMFFLCRRLALSPLACVFAAAAYMLANTSCTLVFAGHHNKLDCFAWIPWFLTLFIPSQVCVRPSKSILAGGFLGAMLLSGEVQICYYLGLWILAFWIGWFILTTKSDSNPAFDVFIRRAGLGLLTVIVSFLVGYASITKSLDVLNLQTVVASATPETNWQFATQFFLPPEEVLSFFTTIQFFGAPFAYWGRCGNPQPLRLSDDYLGLLPIGFAILGGIACWRIWQARLFIFMAVGSLIISFGREGGIFWLLYQLPTMKSQRNPHRWIYFVSLAVCVLAAYGVNWLLSQLRSTSQVPGSGGNGERSKFRVPGYGGNGECSKSQVSGSNVVGETWNQEHETGVFAPPNWCLWKRGLLAVAALGVVLFALAAVLGLDSTGAARTFYGEVAMASPQGPLFAERARCMLFALTRTGFFLAASAFATWWVIRAGARGEQGAVSGEQGGRGMEDGGRKTEVRSLRSGGGSVKRGTWNVNRQALAWLPWAAVFLVLVADLGSNAKRYIVFYPWKQALEENPLANFLRQDKELYRVKVIGTQQNQLLNNLVSNILPYHRIPVVDPPAVSRMPNDYGMLFKHFEQHYVRSDRYFDFFNVKYVLSPGPFADENTPFVPIAQWNGINVYRRENSLPRAWLAANARVVKGGDEEVLKATLHPLTDLRETVVVEEPPVAVPLFQVSGVALQGAAKAAQAKLGGKASTTEKTHPFGEPPNETREPRVLPDGTRNAKRETPSTPRSVRVTRYEDNRVEMATEAGQSTILVLGDKWDPDWKAWVDGVPTRILKANFLMRGVELPTGKHVVRMEYRPSTLPFKVSAACVLLFAGYGLWAGLRALRRKSC